MSFIYSLSGTLDSYYSEKNLTSILEKGKTAGFSYHIFEDTGWKNFSHADKITYEQATQKIISNNQNQKEAEYGPIVYMVMGYGDSITIKIYKLDSGKIRIRWGSLNPERKRYFPGNEYGMDFAYYIEKFVNFYSEFNIISLDTDYF